MSQGLHICRMLLVVVLSLGVTGFYPLWAQEKTATKNTRPDAPPSAVPSMLSSSFNCADCSGDACVWCQPKGATANRYESPYPIPEYPLPAKTEGVQGAVDVELTISRQGKVLAARCINGPFSLRKTALGAAKKCKFAPSFSNGTKSDTGILTYCFSIRRKAPDEIPPMTKSEIDIRRNAITRVTPEYPVFEKNHRLSGDVVVKVLISEDGKVLDACCISGHPQLQPSALNAAQQWRFNPVLVDGKPVKVTGILTFRFTL